MKPALTLIGTDRSVARRQLPNCRWIAADEPGRVGLWNFEYWSQLCLREFTSELTLARSAYRLIKRSLLKPPHILCVIGPVGSGKTVATEVLKSEFGYQEINTGRVVAELLDIPPVPQTPRREFQQKAWQFIHRSDGPVRLARSLAEIARNMNSGRLLVDGLRQKARLTPSAVSVGPHGWGCFLFKHRLI